MLIDVDGLDGFDMLPLPLLMLQIPVPIVGVLADNSALFPQNC